MPRVEIQRWSVGEEARTADYFADGPAFPAILTDATTHWPARRKWNLGFFACEHGQAFGIVRQHFFSGYEGKATTLGAFIDGIDRPIAEMSGFWTNSAGLPQDQQDRDGVDAVWSFVWKAFAQAPSLREDIGSFPPAFANLLAGLDREQIEQLEQLAGFELTSIYISRAGTITPFHADHNHSIGCLAQFEGNKRVCLLDPAAFHDAEPHGFDPESPELDGFAGGRGHDVHVATLEPGDMLIIPPDWWHHTTALDASITLSHNFFTPYNLERYFSGQLEGRAGSRSGAELKGIVHQSIQAPLA